MNALYATQLECLLIILGIGTLLTDAFRPGGNRRSLGYLLATLVTITFYILTSFLRRQSQSLEAGTKYLILGALSSGFTVYGIAYIFGTTGTTNFDKLAGLLQAGVPGTAFTLGMLLVLTGLGFK